MLQAPALASVVVGDRHGASRQKEPPTATELMEKVPICHRRLFFRFTPPGAVQPGEHAEWGVALIEVLVDAEAGEELWRKMQPGGTIALKSQVRPANIKGAVVRNTMYMSYLLAS